MGTAFSLVVDGVTHAGWRCNVGDDVQVRMAGRTYTVHFVRREQKQGGAAGQEEIRASMPGVVVAIHCEAGQPVSTGDKLLTLESMKLQMTIVASREGTIAEVHVKPEGGVRARRAPGLLRSRWAGHAMKRIESAVLTGSAEFRRRYAHNKLPRRAAACAPGGRPAPASGARPRAARQAGQAAAAAAPGRLLDPGTPFLELSTRSRPTWPMTASPRGELPHRHRHRLGSRGHDPCR